MTKTTESFVISNSRDRKSWNRDPKHYITATSYNYVYEQIKIKKNNLIVTYYFYYYYIIGKMLRKWAISDEVDIDFEVEVNIKNFFLVTTSLSWKIFLTINSNN